MRPVWIITFALAISLASPISAQTLTPDGAAAKKSTKLPPIKVQAPREATLTARVKGAGTGRTPGYAENAYNSLKFGSKEWWSYHSNCKAGNC